MYPQHILLRQLIHNFDETLEVAAYARPHVPLQGNNIQRFLASCVWTGSLRYGPTSIADLHESSRCCALLDASFGMRRSCPLLLARTRHEQINCSVPSRMSSDRYSGG